MPRGTTVMVPPGTKGADAAFPPHPSTWDFEWCGRYASSPDSNPKNLDEAEIDVIADHDKGIAYFVEQAEGTPVNSTLEDDKALAKQAVKLARRFELPKGCPFWYAVDTSPFGHFEVIRDSFEVYRDLSDGWPVAAYIGSQGGEYLMDLGLIDYFHIPAALSWSATSAPVDGVTVFKIPGSSQRWYKSPRASLLQHPSIPFAGSRIDRNDTLLATPMWFPGREEDPTSPDPLPPQEIDMTPEEHQMLVDTLALAKENRHLLADTDPGTGVSMYYAAQETHGQIVRSDVFIDRLVAALPPSQAGGGLTEAQVVEAAKTALREGTG